MTESELLAAILLDLGTHPDCKIWRNNRGNAEMPGGRWVKFGVDGQGDISGIIRGGRRWEIETKTRTGKQRDSQRLFQAMIESMGGLYTIARSVDDAREALTIGLRCDIIS